jgi:methylated-DNA-[protein]-cysteine S-methyltransferase
LTGPAPQLGGRSATRPAAIAEFSVAVVGGPWGPIHVATTASGLVGLAVLAPFEPFVEDVARRTSLERAIGGTRLLDTVVAAVEAFVEGRPSALEDVPLDLRVGSAWDRAVLLEGVRRYGWGEVTSYGRVARAIDRPGAARAVGGAIGRNPIGLAIPCHRVIAGDGSIGGFGGDWFGSREAHLEIKRELLAREGVRLPARELRD